MAEYVVGEDGKITAIEKSRPITKEGLIEANRKFQENLEAQQSTATLTPAQCAFVHSTWERYRKAISDGSMTWKQAIENATANAVVEIERIGKVLESIKEPLPPKEGE